MQTLRSRMVAFCLAAAAIMGLAGLPLAAQQREARLLGEAAAAFEQVIQVPEREVPEAMLERATAIAVFPGVRKLGFVVGMQRGRGILLARTDSGRWSPPLVVTLSGVTAGWQIGIQSVDLVIFFSGGTGVADILNGRFTLGVDAGVAAGSLGRQAGAATDAGLRSEIFTYARARGFFAGITLASADIKADDQANEALYGRRGIPPEEILAGRGVAAPKEAGDLLKAVGKATAGSR